MNNKGFTLIETLIYTALLGVVLTGFIAFALLIASLKVRNYVMEEINMAARTANSVMAQKIKAADNIINPVQGAAGNSLTLLMSDGSNTVIKTQAGVLNIKEGSGQFIPLISDEVVVSDLNFINLSTKNQDQNIRIIFTLGFKNSGGMEYSYEQGMQTAVSLRR